MEKIKNKINNYFDSFCNTMKKDVKGTEIAIYTASGILFAISYYRVRPITKFGKSLDIPKYFIQNKVRQYGMIKGVDPGPGGPKILIDHKPPLNFLIPSRKVIPVQLAGINLNSNGYSWLQTVAINHKVEFVPISKDNPNGAECRVFIICPQNKRNLLDLSEALLSLGFAQTVPPINKKILADQEWKKYYKFLSKVEKGAKNQRQGLWLLSLPPKSWPIRKYEQIVNAALLSILPADRRLPELVR